MSKIDYQKLQNQTILHLFKKKNSVFLTTLMSGLDWVWDDTQPTAYASLTTLGFNRDFFALTCDKEMRVTLLAHEVWHVALQHLARGEKYDHTLFNMAADHAINLMLKEHGYTFNIPHLADPRFIGMPAEQIYNTLKNENAAEDLPFGKDIVYMDPKDKEEAAIQQTKLTNLVVKAFTAASMAGEVGNLPGGMSEAIQGLINPELRWDIILSKFFVELSNDERSWRRPNRRYPDIYLPGISGDSKLKNIAWFLDISGSITEAHRKIFNGALQDAKDTCNPEHMYIATFDTAIQQVWEFNEGDSIPIIVPQYGGGTSLHCVREMIIEKQIDAAVIFTDLECAPMDRIPGCEIVWLCFDNRSASVAHGKLIHYNTEDFL